VSLFPLKRSSVADMLPAKDSRSNSSDNSSEMSEFELSLLKVDVNSSLNSSGEHISILNGLIKYLFIS